MTLKIIRSRDNPQVKLLQQLATSSQARKKASQTLLDGIHLCQAWLEHKGIPALCVIGESALALASFCFADLSVAKRLVPKNLLRHGGMFGFWPLASRQYAEP